MNAYEVTFHQEGLILKGERYTIIAATLEQSIETAKSLIPNEYGSEFRFVITGANEIAKDVVLPHARKRKA